MRSFAHVIADREGLHARSCIVLVHEVAKWQSSFEVSCGEAEADGRSLSELLSLHARRGDTLVVSCSGPDEAEASLALEALMRMSI